MPNKQRYFHMAENKQKTGVLFWDVRYLRSTFRSTLFQESLRFSLHENNGMTTTKNWHRNQKGRYLPSQAINFLLGFSWRKKTLKSKIPYTKMNGPYFKAGVTFFQKGGPIILRALHLFSFRGSERWFLTFELPQLPPVKLCRPRVPPRKQETSPGDFRIPVERFFCWIPMGHLVIGPGR